jgi:hypothetical protein
LRKTLFINSLYIMKILLSKFLLCTLLLFGTTMAALADPIALSINMDASAPLVSTNSVTVIASVYEYRYFKIIPAKTESFLFVSNVIDAAIDPCIGIYDENGVTLVENDDYSYNRNFYAKLDLNQGKTYYVMIFLINGNEENIPITITGSLAGMPEVTTSAATSLTTGSAMLGGNITADNGGSISARGVVYSSLNNTPTIGGVNVTQDANGTGIGTFSETITGLTPGITYYYQAYATNVYGTVYGGVQQFIAGDPEINIIGGSNNVSIADGDVTPSIDDYTVFGSMNLGGGMMLSRGYIIKNEGTRNLILGPNAVTVSGDADFVVSVQPEATIAPGSSSAFWINFNTTTVGTHTASVSIVNNDSDENPYNFTIQATCTAPEMNVTGNGVSITDGDATPSTADNTNFGMVSANDAAAYIKTNVFTIQNTGNGNLDLGFNSVSITGDAAFSVVMQPGSFVAPGATMAVGVSFNSTSALGLRTATVSITNNDSDESPYNFTIQATGITIPTLTTTSVTTIGATTATVGGNVTADGSASVTERGVVYSTVNTTPTIVGSNVTKDANGTGTGAFSESISSLLPNTLYYVRAYATNNAGTSYGDVVSFTTASLPAISSVSVPSSKTYKASDVLSFTVATNKAVTVTGSPKLALTIGSTAREATYVSASSTSTALVFTYTVATGDADADGIAVGALSLNGGSIKDNLNSDCNLTLNNLASTTSVKVDGVIPTAIIVLSDVALKAGETSIVTFIFSEAVSGFTTADVTVENGALSGLSSSDGGIVWTATLTPSITITDATNVLSLNNTGVSDLAGNAGSGTNISVNYTIDTARPTATIGLSDVALKAGETSIVTFTFSEAVTGFTTADLSVANGAVSGLSTSDGGIIWTATFTPSASVTDATNVITLDNTGVSDLAGNAGSGTTTSVNYMIDNVNPTVAISSTTTAITYTTPIPVTVTFSETVTGFTSDDVTVNGTVNAFTGSGASYTFTVTPSGQGLVTVAIAAGVAQDAAGNLSTAATSLTRTFDNVAPVISSVTDGGTYSSAQSPTFNEGTATLTKNGGTAVAYLSGTAINTTGSYVLTITDAAGNSTTASFTITLSTGIDDERKPSLAVYPNPCTDGFKVSGIDAPANVIITDLTGRVVVTTMVEVDGDVPVGHLKQGTYLVKVNERVLKLIKK